MDPLVTAVLTVQRVLTLGLGTTIGLAAVGFLLLAPERWLGAAQAWTVLTALGVSLCYRLYRRFGRLNPAKSTRRELEIGAHLAPLVYLLVVSLPGRLSGPHHALIYLVAMIVAAFFATLPAAVTVLSFATLEVLLMGLRRQTPSSAALHVTLLMTFAAINWALFRGEIRRVRRLSKQHLESELSRIKEAARDFRLTGVSRSAADGAALRVSAPQGDEERLLQSSFEHLDGSLRLVLALVRTAVGARTAALLWLHADQRRLAVRGAASEGVGLRGSGYFAREGILAAALSSERMVTLSPELATGRMPLYERTEPCGAVCALRVFDRDRAVGVLLVEFAPGAEPAPFVERLLLDTVRFACRAVESERLFIDLERAKTEQGKLYQAADMLAGAQTEVAVIRAGVEAARQFAWFDFAAVTLHDRSTNTHEICAVSGEGADELVGATFAHNAGLVSMAVANRHPLPYRGEYRRSRQLVFDAALPLPELPSLIILPLLVHDVALGTLVLGSNSEGAFGEALKPTLEILARHVAVSLANARMVKRLEDLATTDGLTGLLNKRAVIEAGKQKIRSAQRFAKPLSLIVGDIDHFKRVNDERGHDVGDVVIRGFADVLRRSKRETDAVGRFGGEEFVIVCEETDAEGARLLAERVRSELAAVTFHSAAGSFQVTCSLGVATLPAAGTSWETLFKATDEALYVSKRGGRNRVTLWSPSARGAAA